MLAAFTEPTFVSFRQDEIGGVIVINLFALISTFALISVALRVIWLAARRYWSPNSGRPQEYIFFHTQLGHYATCLLIGNIFTDTAGLIGLRWLSQKGITEGGVCTAQAVVMQIGNWSTAYFTVTIAVHTFTSLVLRKRQSVLICAATITVGWIASAILAAGPLLHTQSYHLGVVYGANGYSCGVGGEYLKTQFFFHLFPIFLASVLSAILYSIIFLVLRGTLNIMGGITFTLDPNERWVVGSVGENYHRFVARIARSMLWYPIAYIALLIPYSITRLLEISGFTISSRSMVFAYVCWFMLGIVNVLLLYNTFRVLGPAFDGQTPSLVQEDMESFETPEHLKQHMLSLTPERRKSFEEKLDQYRYPAPVHGSLIANSILRSSDQSSIRALLPTHQDRAASEQSFYSYPSSPSIGRSITPIADLNQMINTPQAAAGRLSSGTIQASTEHVRQDSTDSSGLPAPPRRARSPLGHQSSLEHIHSPVQRVNGVWTVVDTSMSRQRSTQTFGSPGSTRNSSGSAYSIDSDLSPTWRSRQNPDISSPSGKHGGPMLSAVTPSLASEYSRPLPSLPRHSRSFSAAPMIESAPAGRQRTLLGVPAGSVDGISHLGHTRASSGQAKLYQS